MRYEVSPVIMILLIVSLLLASALFISNDSSAILAASVTIEFTSEGQVADICEECPAEVHYEGIVKARSVYLPHDQTLTMVPELGNEDLDYEFTPSEFIMTAENTAMNYTFALKIFVDNHVEAGDIIVKAVVVWRYDPGPLAGYSNTAEANLSVLELRCGDLSTPSRVEVNEGESAPIEVTITNTGNTWMDYYLIIAGKENAASKGVSIESDETIEIGLFHTAQEDIFITAITGQLYGDVSVEIQLTLIDRWTKKECSTKEVTIVAKNDWDNDLEPEGDDDTIDESDDDDNSDNRPSEPLMDRSSNKFEDWFIIPIGLCLIMLGIGMYVIICRRRSKD